MCTVWRGIVQMKAGNVGGCTGVHPYGCRESMLRDDVFNGCAGVHPYGCLERMFGGGAG